MATGSSDPRVERKIIAVSGLSDAGWMNRFALWRAYPAAQSPATAPKSKKPFPVYRKEPFLNRSSLDYLVSATREQCDQHHQVGKREQPLVRLLACRFRSPRDKTQVPALRKIADMVDANPGQTGDFRVSKNLLARFDGNHGLVPLTLCRISQFTSLMLFEAYEMHCL